MLTLQSKTVLRGIKKMCGNEDPSFGFLPNGNHLCVHGRPETTYDYSQFRGEINAIFSNLIDEGYVRELGPNSFCLTFLALHYAQVRWHEVKQFLFRSILTPITVSIMTTLITLWLKGAFG